MRPPVIIIGSHRSGTSATALALRSLGLFVGRRLDETHGEPVFFVRHHTDYLTSIGADWHNPGPFLRHVAAPAGRQHCTEFLRRRIAGKLHSLLPGWPLSLCRWYGGWPTGTGMAVGWPVAWGWKEPRTTLFASIWADIFPQARILHVIRHPLDVALSLHRREAAIKGRGEMHKAALEDLDYCLALVRSYVQAGLELADRGDQYREVRFEDLQESPVAVLRQLSSFCGLSPSEERLEAAAAEIDPRRQARWRDLPGAEAARLLDQIPEADRWGYSVGGRVG